MRDPSVLDEILRLVRDLWERTDDGSVAALIHSAVEPAVACDEIRTEPDDALLRKLRAMAFYARGRTGPPNLVTIEHLAALDIARDDATASSYHWLNAELTGMRAAVRSRGVIRVHEDAGPLVFSSVPEFLAWAKARYPAADVT